MVSKAFKAERSSCEVVQEDHVAVLQCEMKQESWTGKVYASAQPLIVWENGTAWAKK